MIQANALGMVAPIHFDDEANRGSEEVHDEISDDDLPPELHAEAFAAE